MAKKVPFQNWLTSREHYQRVFANYVFLRLASFYEISAGILIIFMSRNNLLLLSS